MCAGRIKVGSRYLVTVSCLVWGAFGIHCSGAITPTETGRDGLQDGGQRDGTGIEPNGDNPGRDTAGTDLSGKPGYLTGTIRDFLDTHPDFECCMGSDRGFVAFQLGADGKPVYIGGTETDTTHGQGPFDQWFRDTPGVNQSRFLTIELQKETGGVYTYDNQAFFPIDNQLQGNQGRDHNFHFTYELHTTFTYKGGEKFSFTGDDDLFVYINGRLAIDLGGVHAQESQEADLDAMAAKLGLTKGKPYNLDFFFAERHTTQSHFRIDTTITDLSGCDPNDDTCHG